MDTMLGTVYGERWKGGQRTRWVDRTKAGRILAKDQVDREWSHSCSGYYAWNYVWRKMEGRAEDEMGGQD